MNLTPYKTNYSPMFPTSMSETSIPPTMSNEQELQEEAEHLYPGLPFRDMVTQSVVAEKQRAAYIAGRKATDTAKDKEIAELKEKLVKVAREAWDAGAKAARCKIYSSLNNQTP